MSTRITKIYERIEKIVGVNDAASTSVDIYDSLNDVQRNIAIDTLCLESSSTITTNSSGVATEPTGYFRLKRIVFPDNTEIFPVELDVQEYDVIQHQLFTNISTTVQYYKRWNGSFTFFPNPGVQTWTIHFYKTPTSTIDASTDPEIPQYMDKMLEYGAITQLLLYKNDEASLAKAQMYTALYEGERARRIAEWRRTKTVSNEIYYHDV